MLITRRALIAGALTTPLTVETHATDDLVTLGIHLDEAWTRYKALETQVLAISEEASKQCSLAGQSSWKELQATRAVLGYDRVWKPWSDTVAEVEDVAQQIIQSPARSTKHLLIKHRALVIQLELADMGNPAFTDALDLFGQDLKRLAAG